MNTQIKFTASHRVLHWLMALAMPILFITGFLRMHWMNKNHISGIIESKTNAIPKEQEREITKAIRKHMWVWNEKYAKEMIFAFIARIIYMLVKGIRFPNPFKSNQLLKERLQGFTYLYFYLFVFISAFTGICIEKDLLSAYHDNIEAIHKWGIYWFPIFIVLHLVGIAVAEFSNKKGITSKMIGGD